VGRAAAIMLALAGPSCLAHGRHIIVKPEKAEASVTDARASRSATRGRRWHRSPVHLHEFRYDRDIQPGSGHRYSGVQLLLGVAFWAPLRRDRGEGAGVALLCAPSVTVACCWFPRHVHAVTLAVWPGRRCWLRCCELARARRPGAAPRGLVGAMVVCNLGAAVVLGTAGLLSAAGSFCGCRLHTAMTAGAREPGAKPASR
jgi:hypothetical protein